MSALLQILHWLAGLVVLAEALNKLERAAPCAPGLTARKRLVDWLKVAAWALLAIGGFGALILPVLHLPAPDSFDAAVLVGFATLIVRTRVKEG